MQIYNHITFSLSENDMKMVKAVPEGGNWKDIPLDIPSKRLERIRETGGRTTLYGRLRKNKPSYTITTYFNRPGNGAYIHPTQDRVLSAREAARLQSFPDNYIFQGSKTSLPKQIGNAVPLLLAYAIATQIKKQTKVKNVLDLFCGAGGLSLGFEWAKFNIVAANDNFNAACDTYRANHSNTILIEGDITMNTGFKIKNPKAKSVPGLYEDEPISMDHWLAKAKFQSEVDATLHYLNSTSLREATGATLKRMRFLFGKSVPDELVRTAVSLTYAKHVALKTKKWNKGS